ncbi:MAG: hypothetical protein CMA10_01870 [Euryarchaeota archaeon]|nr:hypothetical protein [Euryarchaeota archaeon]|tara:strand:+ start:378 stop:1052 length:675 start_codon:yes stop_codon:yes gene_type:complete
MNMKYDEDADVRTDTAIKIMALFFASIMFLAFTTDPIASGTKEGQRAPSLEGMSYNGTGWTEFNMDDWLVDNWSEADTTAEWLVVEFMDTDCGFCWDAASDMGQYADYFSKTGAEKWDGPVINFIANAAELNIQGHESSRAEIEAFRDKTGSEACAKGDCVNRPGNPHSFTYIDDLSLDNMDSWKVSGTPTYYLLQPDGIVAWVSSENPNEQLSDAIFRLVGDE